MTSNDTPSVAERRRSWDGGTWALRAGIAAAPVLVTAVWPATGRDVIGAIALLCAAWVPLISLSQWVGQRHPGALATIATIAIDLAAILLIAAVANGLVPVLLVLAVVLAAVHVQDLTTGQQLAVAAVLVAVQAAMVGGRDLGPVVQAVAALDVAVAAAVAVQGKERRRDQERSTAALNRADQLTDAVLTGIGEAVVVTDATGRITSHNQAAETTFGQGVIGTCADALGLRHGAGALDCNGVCPLLDPATGRGQADVSRDHPSGTRQALLVNARAVRDRLGRTREVVHSFRDITAIKQAEQAKTLFLATASHELKTPLAVITGFVDLLDDEAIPPERRREAIDTIRNRGQQLTRIIDRLLLASRIDGDGISLTTQPTDAAGIVRERVDALREVTGRDLRLEATDTVLPSVDADATALATVIDHLVENAVKYSPGGGPITIAMGVGDEHVTVDVADDGVGMSAEAAERCFDAFWQAESVDARRFGGSGVGLYIVRSLSRAMGGDTTVARSAPGRGTTFRLHLVRSDVVREADHMDIDRSTSAVDDVLRHVGIRED